MLAFSWDVLGEAPNFIIPDKFAPVALIKAKLIEDDDGTARA
jgi:hypothetical protein